MSTPQLDMDLDLLKKRIGEAFDELLRRSGNQMVVYALELAAEEGFKSVAERSVFLLSTFLAALGVDDQLIALSFYEDDDLLELAKARLAELQAEEEKQG